MANRYELTQEVREKYKPIVKDLISKVAACKLEQNSRYDVSVDLSDCELNPYTLGKILEEDFGYEHVETETNGWQIDFWSYYTHDTKPLLCITGCAMTFELILRGDEDDTKEYNETTKEIQESQKSLMELIDEGMEIIKQARGLLGEEKE